MRTIGLSDTVLANVYGVAGRRLRVFTLLLGRESPWGETANILYAETNSCYGMDHEKFTLWRQRKPVTLDFILHTVERSRHPRITAARNGLRSLPLAVKNSQTKEMTTLHPALQDLAQLIVQDVHDAAAAFDNPDLYYPGVDEGIAPVPDSHISVVIAAMQRTLDIERRSKTGGRNQSDSLPALPLGTLPWRVQRALVERRRYRFASYGIGRDQWLRGNWSIWEVPEDATWQPV